MGGTFDVRSFMTTTNPKLRSAPAAPQVCLTVAYAQPHVAVLSKGVLA